jgi:hypothetical protein
MAVTVALPGIAQAGDDETAPPDSEATTPDTPITEVVSTLPVLGAGLNVTITRDDTGTISSVGLDPADGATIVKEKDHKVVFLLNDGDTQVIVKAQKNSVQTKVKADATADLTGPGAWTADVFGTGDVTIPYTVAFEGNTPIITIGEVIAPDGVVAETGEAKTRVSEDGDKALTKVKVRLTSGEDSARVTFEARTHLDDDGELRVSLTVSLSTHDRDKHRDPDDRRDRDGDGNDKDRRDDDSRDGDGRGNGERDDQGERGRSGGDEEADNGNRDNGNRGGGGEDGDS